MERVLVSRYRAIGTLCDEPNGLTCSYDVATRWGQADRVEPYPTFESAAADVREGKLPAFLVPAAYPQLHAFIMDANLVAEQIFIMQIPNLVLVGKTETPPRRVASLFHHPATASLIPALDVTIEAAHPVVSNSRACVELLDAAEPAIAITNALCATHYKLHVYATLRHGLRMPFVCFVRSNNAQPVGELTL